MAKYRSNVDWSAEYNSDKQGYARGNENSLFVREESSPGVFLPPAIGTQGKSTSAASPSLDISAGTDTSIKIAVDGAAIVTATIASVVGLNTGLLIAAALETAINNALTTAGQDGRVWVEFAGGLYIVHSQKIGSTSSVVITAAVANDLSDNLKLGTVALGVEVVGVDGTSYLLMTKASMKVSQPFELSKHREGRQPASVIYKKKEASGDLEMYVNFKEDTVGPVLDEAVKLVLEAVLGRKTETSSLIEFSAADAATKFLSLQQSNNAFSRSFNGAYPKNFSISLPGDGEAMMKMSLMARDGRYASVAKISGAVTASATIATVAGQSNRFETGARVMVVDPNGRTVLAGADGSISVASRDDSLDHVVLSTTVTVATNGYLVHWAPIVFGAAAVNNPVTGLVGKVYLGGVLIEEVRSVEFTFDDKSEDLNNYYGADGNRGRVVADKADVKMKLEINLSASTMGQLIATREKARFEVLVVLGDEAGRHMEIECGQVLFPTPDVEIPDNGTVPMTIEGTCLQSVLGANDAFVLRFV